MFFPALGNDLVVMELDSQFRAFLLKTTVWLQDRGSVFHPSQVDQMNARNFWELSGKKQTSL